MSRDRSPYIRGDYWLDKRRDGKSPHIWQIARKERGTIIYRSTGKREADEAAAVLDAHVEELRSLGKQQPHEALIAAHLVNYWKERGKKAVNHDQTGRSLRTFLGFLLQDTVGVNAVVTDLTPVLFARFIDWRMGAHDFTLDWFGQEYSYASEGVSGDTVQRNINDIRAAIYHAHKNMRLPTVPHIADVPPELRNAPRERLLSLQEMGRIVWFAKHNPSLFRFVALQIGTAVRPDAALKFDPVLQYDAATGLIDLQPDKVKHTKKRNAVIPAIRPLRIVLQAWGRDGAEIVRSRKTAWRVMRRTLGLSDDVFPKTIRHTIATMLYSDPTVPEREVVEFLGHDGKLARTTRIYAKYDPNRLQNTTRALTTYWLQVSKEARAFSSDHFLATDRKGGRYIVVRRDGKC